VHAAKRLRNVAVPANRQMRAEGLLQILRGNVLPFDGVVFFIEQCRWMIVPMNLVKCFMAVDALFAHIPMIDDRTDEARVWSLCNLREAFLAAAFAFGPT